MALKRLILDVFPPPRRPVRRSAVLPLLLFLALFLGGCALLDARDILVFSNRKAFLLTLALPWVWWLHVTGFSGLAGARSLIALLTRFALLGVLIMLLADPRAVRKSDALSVVYALDMSDSVGDKAADMALTFITRTVTEKPEKDEAGLVVFGRDAAVELPPRTTFPFEAVNCRLARDATNLEKGLSLAAAMLPEQNEGRIVLISDGTQTEGNYAGVLADLKARRVPVDVLPIEYAFDREVWLEKLELPKTVKLGETYEISVILSALGKGTGTLRLHENGKMICEQPVEFEAGKNRYALPLYLRTPGYYEYVATIETPPGQDGWAENNTAIDYLYLKGEGKVLLVTNPDGDPREWQSLEKALKDAERVVEVQTAFEFPRDALSLMPHDCIVFVNVPADAFDVVQLQALRDAVYHQGTGFLMIGGPNSFGPGGYHRSPIEEALPVTMDITQKKVLPKGALVIILHTCEFPEGNTWGKRVAKEAIRVLSAQDEAGILAYGYQGGEKWIFPLSPVSDYERLVKLINQAEIGDMPSFVRTMRMGLDALKASDAAAKHMIIISDGDPSPPPPEMVNEFVTQNISVSMVAIFPHGGVDISIMRTIASTTGGRYYCPQDPNQLPSIFIKEAKTMRRSMIQNKVIVPRVEIPSPVLKGIGTLPELRGYVLTTPKPRATTILRSPSTEDLEPVLVVWRFGLGKAAAFTSDLSPNWGAAWVAWDRYVAFVKQLMIEISRLEQETNLHLVTYAAGTTGVVLIEDHSRGDSFLEVEARVTGPRNRAENVRLRQTGAKRYEGLFPLWGQGRYRVAAAAVGGGRNERAIGGFVVPYSPEYLRFRSDPIALRQIAAETGGRVLSGEEKGTDMFPKERHPRSSSRSVLAWFLVLLACLVPLDVGVRRVQLDWQVIRGWLGFRSRQAESGQTLSALLQRKKAIEFPTAPETERRLAARAAERRAESVSPGPRPIGAPPAAPTAPAQEKPDGRAAPPQTTTERLLARKKKWSDEKKKNE
ncbi:MAG: hypothetical protein A3K19_14795 [Lentisphaerae bacterium RIFOXYB12_FULL_65_16]|nr:MAG: hypothetical protein A3K18_14370 [Lentisphaerae bacterium RIFOXYA12_64_32]OGV87843.1 MAG: hypothetical protein A3K19_14795 [Lentisphaerae bacterium RIFOXYB12_FULL_65_16]